MKMETAQREFTRQPKSEPYMGMGPIILFDKSALQALSIDESVWFDQFFVSVICPIFFVETLADLEKSIRTGRTPEEEVGLIAVRTPQMSGQPNVNHIDLCIINGVSILQTKISDREGYEASRVGV